MKKKKLLIFGGAGFIGTVLLNKIQDNFDVTVFDSFFFNKINTLKKKYKKINFLKGNINSNIEKSLFQNVDIVIHLAGLANDPSADYNPNNTVLTNHVSTIEISKIAREKKVKKLIYASSCSVYGDHGDIYIDEEIQEKPLTVYALSKYSSEKEILKLATKDFEVISLRLATLFGLSPRMRFDLGVNTMTKQILEKKNIIVNGDGEQYRSFVHVSDVAKTIIFFANLKKRSRHKVFNVGSEINNIKIIDLAKVFKEKFNVKIDRNLKNYDFRTYRVNFDRLDKLFDTKKFVSLNKGIEEIYNFYKNKKINLNSDKFYNLRVVKSK